VIDAKGRLARAYYDALQFQEADRLLQESLAALRRATSPPARQLSETLGLIGELEVTRANFTNAEVALLKAGRIPNPSKADERDRTRAQKRGGDRAHSPC
jgi:outer membrane protein TolC